MEDSTIKYILVKMRLCKNSQKQHWLSVFLFNEKCFYALQVFCIVNKYIIAYPGKLKSK